MADRGLVYVLPDKVWFYCRHTGPFVIDSLVGIDESDDVEDVDGWLYPYDERVEGFEPFSIFLCRMVEIDFDEKIIALKDEPNSLEDPTRKVRWRGSFAEFNEHHAHIRRIWNRMFSG